MVWWPSAHDTGNQQASLVVTVNYVFSSYGKSIVTTFKKDAKHETVEGEQERWREKEMLNIVIIFCGHCSVVTVNIMYMCSTVSSRCSASLSVLKLRPIVAILGV